MNHVTSAFSALWRPLLPSSSCDSSGCVSLDKYQQVLTCWYLDGIWMVGWLVFLHFTVSLNVELVMKGGIRADPWGPWTVVLLSGYVEMEQSSGSGQQEVCVDMFHSLQHTCPA